MAEDLVLGGAREELLAEIVAKRKAALLDI
jgi:hypothetical protein